MGVKLIVNRIPRAVFCGSVNEKRAKTPGFNAAAINILNLGLGTVGQTGTFVETPHGASLLVEIRIPVALVLGSVNQSIVEKLVKYNLDLLSIKVIEMGLCDGLNDQKKKEMVVADCVRLMDEVVASTEGLTGLGLKASYGGVKGIKPGYVAGAIERLLPASLTALDPIWSEGTQTGDATGYLIQNSSRTADALLSVTDAKIEKSRSSLVRNAYKKFRNSSKPYVEKAVPGLAQIIDNYAKG